MGKNGPFTGHVICEWKGKRQRLEWLLWLAKAEFDVGLFGSLFSLCCVPFPFLFSIGALLLLSSQMHTTQSLCRRNGRWEIILGWLRSGHHLWLVSFLFPVAYIGGSTFRLLFVRFPLNPLGAGASLRASSRLEQGIS